MEDDFKAMLRDAEKLIKVGERMKTFAKSQLEMDDEDMDDVDLEDDDDMEEVEEEKPRKSSGEKKQAVLAILGKSK